MESKETILKILSIIPARSGSKRLPHKNIKFLNGKPLIAYSIEQSLESKYINRTIVSTDSREYADFARRYGAEVPFIRPRKHAHDKSTDLEVFVHAIHWLRSNEEYIPDICVHLRPTYPLRKVGDIDRAIEILMDNEDLDSVRTVAKSPFTPFKMWFRDDDETLRPVTEERQGEPWNLPKQVLRESYIQTANIDVIRTSTIMHKASMTGEKIHGMIVEHSVDIDSEVEFRLAQELLDDRT